MGLGLPRGAPLLLLILANILLGTNGHAKVTRWVRVEATLEENATEGNLTLAGDSLAELSEAITPILFRSVLGESFNRSDLNASDVNATELGDDAEPFIDAAADGNVTEVAELLLNRTDSSENLTDLSDALANATESDEPLAALNDTIEEFNLDPEEALLAFTAMRIVERVDDASNNSYREYEERVWDHVKGGVTIGPQGEIRMKVRGLPLSFALIMNGSTSVDLISNDDGKIERSNATVAWKPLRPVLRGQLGHLPGSDAEWRNRSVTIHREDLNDTERATEAALRAMAGVLLFARERNNESERATMTWEEEADMFLPTNVTIFGDTWLESETRGEADLTDVLFYLEAENAESRIMDQLQHLEERGVSVRSVEVQPLSSLQDASALAQTISVSLLMLLAFVLLLAPLG